MALLKIVCIMNFHLAKGNLTLTQNTGIDMFKFLSLALVAAFAIVEVFLCLFVGSPTARASAGVLQPRVSLGKGDGVISLLLRLAKLTGEFFTSPAGIQHISRNRSRYLAVLLAIQIVGLVLFFMPSSAGADEKYSRDFERHNKELIALGDFRGLPVSAPVISFTPPAAEQTNQAETLLASSMRLSKPTFVSGINYFNHGAAHISGDRLIYKLAVWSGDQSDSTLTF